MQANNARVDRALMERLAASFEAEARSVEHGDTTMTTVERRLRAMHGRCFRAAADRLRRTVATGKLVKHG